MQRALARRIRAVVATGTIVDNVCVIEVGRQPGDSRVAIVAVFAAGDMRWVLAGRRDAVVTRSTGPDDLRMVNVERRHPCVGGVTILANVGCLNVVQILAGRIGAIVATGTVTRDIDVIEVSRQPAYC